MLANLLQDLYSVICWAGLAALVAMLLVPRLREAFERRCLPPATAVDLAFIRIVACAVLLLYIPTEELASQAAMGTEWFRPPGHLSLLGRGLFDWFLSSEGRLQALTLFVFVSLALALVGCATRVTLPLAAVSYFLFAALLRSFGKEFHEGYLGFYVLVVLCFLPCADAWSIDARWLQARWRRWLRRPRQTPPARGERYRWGAWACYAAAALPYLQLGMSKLIEGGIFWFDGRSLRNYMLRDNVNLTDFDIDLALRFYDIPVILFTIAGFVALLVELSYAWVLVSPRLRRVLPACVAFLHLGIWLGQDVRFLDAMLIPAIFFLPSRSRWPWLKARAGAGPAEPPGAEKGDVALAPETRPTSRWRFRLHGHQFAIAVAIAILFLQYTTYRKVIRWQWPVEPWTMYAPKAKPKRQVNHRRFLAHNADGTSRVVNLGEAFAFLGKAYRLDHGVRRNLPAFLIRCLTELRTKQPDVVGLSYERRTWPYGKRTLEEHLRRDPPRFSFRVMEVAPAPPALRQELSAGPNLVANGGFDRWDKKTAMPVNWKVEGSWLGMAVGLVTGERAAMLTRSPSPQSLSQTVVLPDKLTGGGLELRAEVLASAAAPGAQIELQIKQPGTKRTIDQGSIAASGTWQRVEVTKQLSSVRKGTELHIVLRNPGTADVTFDDVRLVATPAAASP